MTLLDIEIEDKLFSCSASIVNNLYIMTAAHCFPSKHDIQPEDVKAYNGPICEMEELRKTEPLAIERIIAHEKYEGIDTYHDIALLELKEPLEFNETFSPICLPGFTNFDNFFASGWGLINEEIPGLGTALLEPTCLMEAELKMRNWMTCKEFYGDDLPTSQVLCAGGDSGVCQGDSGGPLMSRKYGRVYQAGITSFGNEDCGVESNYPGVFEKVFYHREWIRENTDNADWCRGPNQLIDVF